jgi:hypothetical protein
MNRLMFAKVFLHVTNELRITTVKILVNRIFVSNKYLTAQADVCSKINILNSMLRDPHFTTVSKWLNVLVHSARNYRFIFSFIFFWTEQTSTKRRKKKKRQHWAVNSMFSLAFFSFSSDRRLLRLTSWIHLIGVISRLTNYIDQQCIIGRHATFALFQCFTRSPITLNVKKIIRMLNVLRC